MKIIKFIHAWFYYSTFREWCYQEGTRPAQTRLIFIVKHRGECHVLYDD